MKSTEQLELEGEQARERISETLDELRARLTPGQVLDQVVDYARSTGGAAFARNLGQQIVDNPLPVALLGTGLVWLMLADGRARRRVHAEGLDATDLRAATDRVADAAHDAAGSARSAGRSLLGRAKSVVSGMRSTVSDAADTVRDATARSADAARSAMSGTGDGMRAAASRSGETASSLIASVRARAASTYGSASQATRRAASSIGDSTSALGRSVGDRSQEFVEFCKEQPLVLAGLGVAVGAAIGAALPVSEAEDRLMGEMSDDIKDRMQRVADRVKEGAKATYDEITEPLAAGSAASGPRETSSGDDAGGASASARGSDDRTGSAQTRSAGLDDPAAMRGDDDCAGKSSDQDQKPRYAG